jgi:hypothetical protein
MFTVSDSRLKNSGDKIGESSLPWQTEGAGFEPALSHVLTPAFATSKESKKGADKDYS